MRFCLSALTLCAATAVQADGLTCSFDQECFEGDACAATDFSLALEITAPGPLIAPDIEMQLTPARLVTDAETIDGLYLIPVAGGVEAFTSLPGPVTHAMALTAEGAARYAVIFAEDGFVITYSGTCRAAEQ